MDPHRVERDLVRGLRCQDLRDEELRVVPVSRRGVVREEPRRRDLGRHSRERELDRLVVGDRLAEGRALLRIAKRGLERGLRQADARRRDAEPRDLEDRRTLLVSTAGLTAESIL